MYVDLDYSKHYMRSCFGGLILCSTEDFEFVRWKIEEELPGYYMEYVTGFGIQIAKWMYQGKELLREVDYAENYEEIDPIADTWKGAHV